MQYGLQCYMPIIEFVETYPFCLCSLYFVIGNVHSNIDESIQ